MSEQKEDWDLDSYAGAGSCANIGAVCPSLHKTHLGRVRPDSHSFFPREPCSLHHLNSSVIWEQKTWDKSSQSRWSWGRHWRKTCWVRGTQAEWVPQLSARLETLGHRHFSTCICMIPLPCPGVLHPNPLQHQTTSSHIPQPALTLTSTVGPPRVRDLLVTSQQERVAQPAKAPFWAKKTWVQHQ